MAKKAQAKRVFLLFIIIYLAYETLWIPTEIAEGIFDISQLNVEIVLDGLTCLAIAAINVCFAHYVERHYFGKSVTGNRVMVLGLLATVFNMVVIVPLELVNAMLYRLLMGRSVSVMTSFVNTYAIGVITVLIISLDIVRRWQLERLEQSKRVLTYQIEALTNKVDPHFLFNNISVGISLISSDPGKAKRFFMCMASLYRRTMNENMRKEVLLGDDIGVAQEYYQMISIRYGEMVKLIDETTEVHKRYRLWAGTVQLLIENAVKHNVFSEESPLHIKLRMEDDILVVSNEYRLRRDRITTFGTGYEVLNLKYDNMLHSGVDKKIGEEEQWVVRIRLKCAK